MLPPEDQEQLIHILKNRLRDQKRAELIKDIDEAQQEYAKGQCQPATPQQLMEEILTEDIIVFDGLSVDQLEQAFKTAIEQYLMDYQTLNKIPNQPTYSLSSH